MINKVIEKEPDIFVPNVIFHKRRSTINNKIVKAYAKETSPSSMMTKFGHYKEIDKDRPIIPPIQNRHNLSSLRHGSKSVMNSPKGNKYVKLANMG